MPGAQLMYILHLILNLYFIHYTMAQDIWTLWRKTKVTAGSQAAQALSKGSPFLNGRSEQKKTVHGPPVQSRVAAAIIAVPAICARILAHMVMNGGGAWAKAKAGRQGMA